ncbi:MAG: mechanosensitive ion channel family protein [Oscillospiraceae bacterium]
MKIFFEHFFTSSEWGYVLLRMGFILAITLLVVNIFKAAMPKTARFQRKIHQRLLRNGVIYIIYIAGIVGVISQLPGLDKALGAVLAGSGILAVVLGLAAQKSLGNAIDGLFISIFHPFEIGDRVNLVSKSITGYVEDMSLRQTVLRTYTNNRVIVPNSVMSQEILENSNFLDGRIASFIDVTITYDSNLDKAMELMARIIEEHPYYTSLSAEENKIEKKGPPKVYLHGFTQSGIGLRASMWCDDIDKNFEASSDVRYRFKHIGGQQPQVLERAVAGAKIIQRNADAGGPQAV